MICPVVCPLVASTSYLLFPGVPFVFFVFRLRRLVYSGRAFVGAPEAASIARMEAPFMLLPTCFSVILRFWFVLQFSLSRNSPVMLLYCSCVVYIDSPQKFMFRVRVCRIDPPHHPQVQRGSIPPRDFLPPAYCPLVVKLGCVAA